LLILGFLSFLAFGLMLVLVGANQAEMAAEFDLDLSDTGLVVAIQVFGLGVGVVAAGPLFDRYARRPLFVASLLTSGIALSLFRPGMSFAECLILIALVGLGSGGYDTLLNALVAERYGDASARPMSVLHAAVTIGAVAGPLVVGEVSGVWHWTTPFQWTGILQIGIGFAVAFLPLPPPPRHQATADSLRAVLSPAIVPFALVAFAYVGVEGAMTVFATPYSTTGLGLEPWHGPRAISAFWLGLLIGRLSPLLLRGNLDARALVWAGGVSCAVIAGGSLAAVRQVEASFLVTGLALGVVYPLMISLASRRFPEARGTAAGVTAGAGAVGGFVIPWASGGIGDVFGIVAAVVSLAAWSALIAVGGLAAVRLTPRSGGSGP
jgi:fucose permease